MNLLTQVFRSYWLASVHNSQNSSLQRSSFFTWRDSPNNWFLASWLAGLFGLTAGMLKFFSSWVRDRWSPTRSAAPEYMYPIFFRHSYNHSRKTSSQELLMFKIIANSLIKKNTHTHTHTPWKIAFWRKPTFSIPFILVSCLSSFQQEDLETIDHSNFHHHHHHHHERSYSINWGQKQDKTKQTYVNFEKPYVIILPYTTTA